MEELDKQLNDILGNPNLMQQIMNLANQMNTAAPAAPSADTAETPPPAPMIDSNAIRSISNILSHAGTDKNQQALLNALRPYVSRDKITKLEKAMQAAKMAQLASHYFGTNNPKQLFGG